MKPDRYQQLRRNICDSGYAGEIKWAETVAAPENAEYFAQEYAFVVCNSGMKAQIARVIYDKVMAAIAQGQHPATVFGHKGKAGAIWSVWTDRESWFSRFKAADDKVSFLESMPWIGPITKWHLAKNFGVDVAKPDRHLIRVADFYGMTPQAMCEQLANASGDRVGTVDYVIWRACNLGLINSNEMA